jgi:hypothetical protein
MEPSKCALDDARFAEAVINAIQREDGRRELEVQRMRDFFEGRRRMDARSLRNLCANLYSRPGWSKEDVLDLVRRCGYGTKVGMTTCFGNGAEEDNYRCVVIDAPDEEYYLWAVDCADEARYLSDVFQANTKHG